jgi:hypothetical protein
MRFLEADSSLQLFSAFVLAIASGRFQPTQAKKL